MTTTSPDTHPNWVAESTTTRAEAVSKKQSWIRRDTPESFFWRGLWPVLAVIFVTIYALWPFAKDEVESTVRSELRTQLDAASYEWVNVSVSGQQVTLRGTPPSATAASEAMMVARKSTCPSWTLRWVCAVQVTAEFASVEAVKVTLPAASAAATTASPASVTTLPPASIATAAVIPPQPFTVAPSAVSSASAVTPRPVTTTAVTTTATTTVAPPVTATAAASGDKTVSIAQVLALHPCESAMAAAVSRSRIAFTNNSAVLSASSASVLDELASAARRCPGAIEVQGHTDAVGSPARNLDLSKARAAAVRQALVARGVPARRLVTQGWGDKKPMVSNDTPEGRAQNRRIEFHLVKR
jgi:outer membrane protein OmpA-like peptidoglycan-associated protein